MEHSTQSTVEHIVSFTQTDADLIGNWLINVFDELDNTDGGRDLKREQGFELACDLADYLNGVN